MKFTHQLLELLMTKMPGQVGTTPERREAVLDEIERSGLSAMRVKSQVPVGSASLRCF